MTHGNGNADSNFYWQGAKEGRLLFQRCTACGHVQFPPRQQCETCWSDELDVVASSGRGKIESFTIVRRAPLPALRDRVPYAIAAIRVDEGVRMITNLVGTGALDARIGDPVAVTFEVDAEGTTLPQFQLA